jgi:Holliday junction resolvase RusA-like endonuclease
VTPQEQAAARVRERTAELVAEIAAVEQELARRLQPAPPPANATKSTMQIELPFPPSANTAYPTNRRGGRHLSKAGRAWKQAAAQLLAIALHEYTLPDDRALVITMHAYLPDNRPRDLANHEKLPIDALCEYLNIDDNWQRVVGNAIYLAGIEPDNPRIVLQVQQVARPLPLERPRTRRKSA